MPSVLYKKKNLVDLPPDSLKTYTVNVVYEELNGRKKRKGDAGKSEVFTLCPAQSQPTWPAMRATGKGAKRSDVSSFQHCWEHTS